MLLQDQYSLIIFKKTKHPAHLTQIWVTQTQMATEGVQGTAPKRPASIK